MKHMTGTQFVNELAQNFEIGINTIALTISGVAEQLGLSHGSHETKQFQEVMPPALPGEEFVEYEKRIQTEAFQKQRARDAEILRTSSFNGLP